VAVREFLHDATEPRVDLASLYSPRSVVVIGASRQPGKLGHDVMVECARLGFAGSIVGVNPHADAELLAGWPLVRSLDELSDAPDLALLAVPAAAVLDAVSACARAGVRAAVIAAAGLGELGGDGARLEDRIARVARAAGMRLLGPNGFGLYVGSIGLNLMGWRDIPPGRVALLTQSGNVAIALCRLASRSTVGFSSCTGMGNQIDVSAVELLSYHAQAKDSDAIALYLEGLRGSPGPAFVRSLEACAAAGKPVVVLKGGRSSAGRRSVTTHTAALGGDRRLWDTALRQGGAHQVLDPEEMVEVLEALRATRDRRVRAVLVLTDGGGDTVLAADALEDAGVPLAHLGQETEAALDALVPRAAPRAEGRNPVTLDTAGGLEDDPGLLARCAEIGDGDRGVDAIVVSGTFGGYRAHRADELAAVRRLAALHERGTAVLVHSAFALDDEEPVAALRRAGIPVYRTMRRLTAALGTALGTAPIAASTTAPGRPAGSSVASSVGPPVVLSTVEAMAALSSVGVVTPAIAVVSSEVALLSAVERLGPRVCLKLEDAAVSHKSDVGGVVLGLGPDTVTDAARELWRRFPGRELLVMPMLDPGIELLVGIGLDETFGPYLTVGRGGVATELDPDVALGLLPCDGDAARAMWCSLRCARLLSGWRSSPAVDLPALVALSLALSRLAERAPGLEIECNPVLIYPQGYAIADVRGVRGPA
jgi:acyl-CoA synthetase (NDP forming)